MTETIRKHEYNYSLNGTCAHCGDRESDNTGEKADRLCVARNVPRPVPVSVFAEIDPIYDRIHELRREQNERLAGTTTIE